MIRRLATLFAALWLIGAAPADWTAMVVETESGSYIMGNPQAPVRVTEYMSFTCPYCAEFKREDWHVFKAKYIKTGKVSIETRMAFLSVLDLAASVAAKCGGPENFYGNSGAFFAQQRALVSGGRPYARENKLRTKAETPLLGLAKAMTLDAILEARGIKGKAFKRCMADKQVIQKSIALNDAADIAGTPAFFINGTLMQESADWRSLDLVIKGALAAPTTGKGQK